MDTVLARPDGGRSRANNGSLWDIHTFDLAGAFGASGPYTLQMDGQSYFSDCLGLVVLLLDLKAGSAPATPTVTPTPPVTGGCQDYLSDDTPKDIPANGSRRSGPTAPH